MLCQVVIQNISSVHLKALYKGSYYHYSHFTDGETIHVFSYERKQY